MKTCSASTRAASTLPTTSWSMSATSTACPRSELCPPAALSNPSQPWFGIFLNPTHISGLPSSWCYLCRRQQFLLLLNFLPFYCRTPKSQSLLGDVTLKIQILDFGLFWFLNLCLFLWLQGRNNMFHTLLMFLYIIKTKESGMLG